MPFSPISSLFFENIAQNISSMPALVFKKMPRPEKKFLFSDNLPSAQFFTANFAHTKKLRNPFMVFMRNVF